MEELIIFVSVKFLGDFKPLLIVINHPFIITMVRQNVCMCVCIVQETHVVFIVMTLCLLIAKVVYLWEITCIGHSYRDRFLH